MVENRTKHGISVDLRALSTDTRAALRWVARQECAMDDDDRCDQSEHNPLIGVDDALLRRVERKIRRLRFRVTPQEAECLRLLIYAVQDRFGAENLKDVQARMDGDDEAYMEPYDYLPYQPDSDPEEQDEELSRLMKVLDSALTHRAGTRALSPSPATAQPEVRAS
jgi:hypothetical protein